MEYQIDTICAKETKKELIISFFIVQKQSCCGILLCSFWDRMGDAFHCERDPLKLA